MTKAEAFDQALEASGLACAPRTAWVNRQCPKCHHRRDQLGNAGGINHRIRCSHCSHEWDGRVMAKERACPPLP